MCNPFANPGQHNAEYNVGHTEHWRRDEGQFPKDLTKDSTRNSYATWWLWIGANRGEAHAINERRTQTSAKMFSEFATAELPQHTEKHPWEGRKSSQNDPEPP